jgi:hypothetical protein
MWMRKTGRRKNFKLKQKFYPNSNYCTLHVSGQITQDMILTLTSPEKNAPMINALSKIEGMKRITPEPYDVTIEKEESIDWQKILPEAEKIVIQHLVKK